MKYTALLFFLACSPAATPDAGGAGVDAGSADAGTADAGGDAGIDDAGGADAGGVDAGGADAGLGCTFNDDCRPDERCDCDEQIGCFCAFGVRGTGVNGVDVCTDGADCETSLCVEGTDQFYCSGPCVDDGDCGPSLPLCADIAFVGRICIRQ